MNADSRKCPPSLGEALPHNDAASVGTQPFHIRKIFCACERFPTCLAPVQVRAKSPKQKRRISMKKVIFANRFGLIALMSLSLFASTAFAGANPAPTQVVVTNTPAQPVPMVALVKDSDAPARKPFQWDGASTTAATSARFITVTTA